MKQCMWDPKPKAAIILRNLKGKPVALISQEYQISHAPPVNDNRCLYTISLRADEELRIDLPYRLARKVNTLLTKPS